MIAYFIQFGKYSKSYFPKFSSVTNEVSLLSWIRDNGGDFFYVDNFTQSPNSGVVSILGETLENEELFPNYLVIIGPPLNRYYGYFLTFHGMNSNLNVYTFNCEIDPLFYPATNNAGFRCDIIKTDKSNLNLAFVDLEKLQVGEKFKRFGDRLISKLESDMFDIGKSYWAKGWVIYASTKDWGVGEDINGIHFFTFPYASQIPLQTGTGYLADYGEVLKHAPFLTDTNLIGVYFVPYCPCSDSLEIVDGQYVRLKSGSQPVELVPLSGSFKMLKFKNPGNAYPNIIINSLSYPSVTNYLDYLKISNDDWTVGEVSYAIGNQTYSELLPPTMYDPTTSINQVKPLYVVTLLNDKVSQYIEKIDDLLVESSETNEVLWTCPPMMLPFPNDSYLKFMTERAGTLWASSLLSVAGSTAAAVGSGLSPVGVTALALSIGNAANNIGREYQNARNQRNAIQASNNMQLIADMMITYEVHCYYGYRYNPATVDFNRFSVIKPNSILTWNSNIEYVRFIDFPSLPLYTDVERTALSTRGVVLKL